MRSDESNFNLINEKWINVIDVDGKLDLISLRELFNDSERISSIAGEIPTQDFAIFRLCLAIAHRAVEGPMSEEHWFELWDDKDAFIKQINVYLDTWEHRFNLFDPVVPFYQTPTLKPTNADTKGDLVKIIADVPDNFPFFATRSGKRLESLSYSESARWLIHVQAFDTSGIKTGMQGDPRVKNGKGYAIGTGWAGNIGGLVVVGNNIQDTLLINLVPKNTDVYDINADYPVWEGEPLTGTPTGWISQAIDKRVPRGKVDLYTWQARRVLLIRSETEESVVNVFVGNGDKIQGQNQHLFEPMTAWRYSKAQTDKTKKTTYMPQQHDPSKRLWMGLQGLTSMEMTDKTNFTSQNIRFAANVREDAGLGEVLNIRSYGMEYGANAAVYGVSISDSLALPKEVLVSEDYSMAAVTAVEIATNAVDIYAELSQNLVYAAGGIPPAQAKDTWLEAPRAKAKEEAFSVLENHFRIWLENMPNNTPESSLQYWRDTVRSILSDMGDNITLHAGISAIVGRKRKPEDKHIMNAARAHNTFQYKLLNELPRGK